MHNYKKLDVWKQSHELTLSVYKNTLGFPSHELFGLTGQLRRATSSIPCNIVEGCSRDSKADFARFLEIAHGSTLEVEYLLLLTHDLGYSDDTVFEELNSKAVSISKQLFSLRRSVSPRP